MNTRSRIDDGPAEEEQIHDVLDRIKRDFLSTPHSVPNRPDCLNASTVIIRKRIVPFYHAIYSHPLHRFVELHVPMGPKGTLHVVPLPSEPEEGPNSDHSSVSQPS